MMNAWLLQKSDFGRGALPCVPVAWPALAAWNTLLVMFAFVVGFALLVISQAAAAEPLPRIGVSDDGKFFVERPGQTRFVVWGVNYDHDRDGRLLDEYWEQDWETVRSDFAEIKALGANCVRIHLQVSEFLESANRPKASSLERLRKLLEVAQQQRLYLNITGLACYHKQNVPAWFNALSEAERWQAQAVFWEAIAGTCKQNSAVFCYDLMNEPILPGKRVETEWLGGELGGKFFVQRLALDAKGRSRQEIAKAWVDKQAAAIRKHDPQRLVTVGVIPWVFAFGGGKPLFHSPPVNDSLDFVAVHFYPKQGEVEKALKSLKAYEVGKPLLVEEMFPLKCSRQELAEFVQGGCPFVDGWTSFYWGATSQELRDKPNASIGDAITAAWLDEFSRLAKTVQQAPCFQPADERSK